jgi:1-acyl-sn-glycerol-3-phosphate acyltransferase
MYHIKFHVFNILMSLYYHTWRYIFRALVPILVRMEVRGLHHVPRTGSCLLVGNHLSMVDPACLFAYIPRHIRFIAKAEALETWPLSVLLPPTDLIKVHRGHADRQALRQAEQHLKRGNAVMIYAEGTRSKTGAAQEARAGVVFLAQRTGAPLVPVAISGSERVFSKRFPWYRRAHVQMTFGTPFRLEDLGLVMRGNRDQLAHAVMERVAALLPPRYRGAYDADGLSTVSVEAPSQAGAQPHHLAASSDIRSKQG